MAEVLLLEPDRAALATLETALAAVANLNVAKTGQDALEALRNKRIAVIVSSARPPDMEGPELLRRAREVSPDTIRLLLVGYDDLDAAIVAVNEGHAFRFLTRPITAPMLQRHVEEAIAISRSMARDGELIRRRAVALAGRLERAERRGQGGTIAAAVGHDLCNAADVLGAVVPAIRESADANLPPSTDSLRTLDLVLAQLRHHGTSLSAIGRAQTEAGAERLNLGELASEVLETLRAREAASATRIELTTPPEPIYIEANRGGLEQVLINVLSNAIDATAKNTSARIEMRIESLGVDVRILVMDTGCGIAEDRIGEVFKAYVSSKGGAGLGLRVAKQIVSAHRGEIELRSVEGRGTIVEVVLPRSQPRELVLRSALS